MADPYGSVRLSHFGCGEYALGNRLGWLHEGRESKQNRVHFISTGQLGNVEEDSELEVTENNKMTGGYSE